MKAQARVKRVGKYKDKAPLYVWINAFQRQQLKAHAEQYGWTLSEAVNEAILFWNNSQRARGKVASDAR